VGCQSSKNTPPNTSRNVTEGTGAPLSNQEILERIDAPVKSETLEIGGFKVRYKMFLCVTLLLICINVVMMYCC
jgi:hypothetical protein